MVKAELIKRSPLRILEKSTHGGLGKGNLGVITARRGVGKTAFLVHLATDQLFQDKPVIHVSFSTSTNHIIDWYEDIFGEIKKRHNLDSALMVHDEIVKKRVIMNFNQDGPEVLRVIKSLKSMIAAGHFPASVIVVDGFDFSRAGEEDISNFKSFAEEMELEIWFSATKKIPAEYTEDEDNRRIDPSLIRFDKFISILIVLIPMKGYIHIELIKDHDSPAVPDMHLKLDPKILLISRED